MNNSTQQEGITVKEAVKVLCDSLSEDRTEGSYYYSWQANIAMAFYDEYRREFGNSPKMSLLIHEIANQAAQNFLDLLIGTPYNHHPVNIPSPPTVSELKSKFAEHLGEKELNTTDAYAVEWVLKNLK